MPLLGGMEPRLCPHIVPWSVVHYYPTLLPFCGELDEPLYSLSGIRGPPAQATLACSFYKIFRILMRRWRHSGFTTEALRVLYRSEL
jgi:hypothetical protein